MKKHLLLLLILTGGYLSVFAQYHPSKTETIARINTILKLREETRSYSPEPGKTNHLILSQQLGDDAFKQVLQSTDKKQLTTIVTKINWDAFRAFGYNDNRSELYIYFNKKISVNNTPAEVFSLYVPDDKVDSVKNTVLRLVGMAKGE